MVFTEFDTGMRDRLRQRLDQLPSLPSAVTALMQLDPGSDEYVDELLTVLEADPNFAARVLSAANSSASAPAMPMTSLRDAVTRLGPRQAVSMVMAVGLTHMFVPRDPWERSLWLHGLQTAAGCRELASACDGWGVDPGAAYTAGLVHDIGRFVLFQEAPDELRRIDEGGWASPDDLIREERSVCGLAHTEIAAVACRQWGLPSSITMVAALHHEREFPDKVPVEVVRLVRLVHFVDLALFPSALPGANEGRLDVRTIGQLLVPHLPDSVEMTAAELHDVAHRALESAEQAATVIGL
ncbi:MAG: HDOD domain-containing protein [Actinomycetota bacterium]